MDMEQLVGKYDALATQIAPEALDMAVQTTQMGGLVLVVTGLFLLILYFSIIYFAYKLNPTFNTNSDKTGWQIAIITFCSFFFLIPGFVMVVDMWNWIAIWHPDLALTHQIINGLTSTGSN